MQNLRLVFSAWCVFWAFGGLAICQAAPSAADFLPIDAGGSGNVADPAAVKVDPAKDRVQAASGQDAANAGVEHTTKELASTPATSAACFMSFPSGCGVLATGRATYKVVQNPELSRLAQRRSFVQAFMFAKKEMAQFLDGLTNEARDEISKTVARLNESDKEGATNRAAVEISTLQQQVSKLLKGFVVYEVSDEQKEGIGTVLVTIATSPATCLQTGRQAGGVVSAATLAEGIDRMLLEIRQGVVAPVGGRIIEVPGTNETAFVGFGAAVVGDSKDPETRAELLATAEKSARMYASDALCGLLRGDQTAWTGTIVEKHQDSFQEFVDAQADDPLNAGENGSTERLAQSVSKMINTQLTNDMLTSARSNRLPGGIPIKSWMDDKKHWAYAVAIYFPSASKKAGDIGKMMDNADLVPDAKAPVTLPSQGSDGPVKSDSSGKKPLPSITPLPGGKVGGQKL